MNLPNDLRKILLSPIRPARVSKDGKGFSHVEAYEIRAHLTRLFDFGGWSSEVEDMQEVFEIEREGRWTVCYRALVKLRVEIPLVDANYGTTAMFSEWATGESKNQPSRGDAHDLAIKTAESQALKRCAMNLGDQFGLSLYKKGSLDALVGRVWQPTPAPEQGPAQSPAPAVDEHVTETPPESEQAPVLEDVHEQSSKPALAPAPDHDQVPELTRALLRASSKADLSALAIRIARAKLNNAQTADADGNALSLQALLDQRLKASVKVA